MRHVLLTFLLATCASPAWSMVYVVTRTDDPDPAATCVQLGGCGLSLRQAVLAANKRPGADLIVLGRAVYTLTRTTSATTLDGRSGPLWVTDTLEVVGDSAARTRIRWSASTLPHQTLPHRHQVWAATEPDASLALANLTVSHGQGTLGGCILRSGAGYLSLQDAVVELCSAQSGGAIYLRGVNTGSHTLSLNNTELRNNQASLDGGAVVLVQSATVIANGVTLRGNSALRNGGAFAASPMITQVLSYPINIVWRSGGAGTLFADNSAVGDGGAIALNTPGFANFYAVSGTPMLRFAGNVAGNLGGAVAAKREPFPGSPSSSETRLILERASFESNAASQGGAVALLGTAALITRNEFKSNAALSGNGGAVFADYSQSSLSQRVDVTIRQSSFRHNSASSLGGALANECQQFNVRNSAFHANSAAQGEAISSAGSAFLGHVTTAGHAVSAGAAPATIHKRFHTLCGAQSLSLANSLLSDADGCLAQHGLVTSLGGNAFGAGGSSCGALPGLDLSGNSSLHQLSLGTFGGEFEVLGWNTDGQSRPQVNFALGRYCDAEDIRGLPRADGACDSGAFEQQP